jgi:hypothetical protein
MAKLQMPSFKDDEIIARRIKEESRQMYSRKNVRKRKPNSAGKLIK